MPPPEEPAPTPEPRAEPPPRVTPADEVVDAYLAREQQQGRWSFRLSGLILAVTLVAIWLGVLRLAPGFALGILIAPLLGAPLWFLRRAATDSRQRGLNGYEIVAYLALILSCVGIVFLAVCAAFFTACFAGFMIGEAQGGGGGLLYEPEPVLHWAIACAVVVLLGLATVLLWPRRKK